MMDEGELEEKMEVEGEGDAQKGRWRWRAETVRENYKECLREIRLHVSASGPRHQQYVKITCPIMKRDCWPPRPACFTVRHPTHPPPPRISGCCIHLNAAVYCF